VELIQAGLQPVDFASAKPSQKEFVMTGPSRVLRTLFCVAAIALHTGGLGAAEPVVTKAAERLAALLKRVPSNYLSFPFVKSPTANEVSDVTRSLSDAELRETIRNAQGPRLELFLCEAIRRGGQEWNRFVAARWEAEREAILKAARDSAEHSHEPRDLAGYPSVEWLTAMRRLDRKPDPLQILVAGRQTRSCFLGHPLRLFVLLTNLDVDRAEVQFTDGGDYRGGRQARWRLEVTDREGRVLPARPPLGSEFGGLYREDTLRYGESWATELNIGSFVRIEAPGKYKIRVLYHDHVAIADCDDVAGLIVSTSLPIDLTVEPITIEATRAELDAVRKAISEVPAKGSVKFVEGDYDERAYDFIKPGSAPGKLLTMGWKSVPAMIDAVLDEKVG
jgi:hypothetical protein